MHGLNFGLSQSQTNFWIHHLLPVLRAALQELGPMPVGLTPERQAPQVQESPLIHEGALLLDGTERRWSRPQEKGPQKAHYSGKNKAHTDKTWY